MDRILAYLRYIFRITPSWKDCSKASCWQGSNAATRHMNILSPKFTDGQFRAPRPAALFFPRPGAPSGESGVSGGA